MKCEVELELRVDLQIFGADVVNFVFTKRLRPTYAGKKYAIFALNSLNLPRAPVALYPMMRRCTEPTQPQPTKNVRQEARGTNGAMGKREG